MRIPLAFAVLLVLASFSRAQEPSFRAGAFAQDITPIRFPITVNGGMADRQATGAHDRLHARCLVLDDGKTKLAFAVCDSCMIPREITDAAKVRVKKSFGLAPEQIIISATHTHSAPTVAGVFQSDPDEAYQKFLSEKIAEGILQAHQRLQPAEIGWGIGLDPSQVFNRRWRVKNDTLLLNPFGGTDKVRMNPPRAHPDLIAPAGPIDPEVSILSIRTREGKPLAILANYSLHYVGGNPNLSADYFGAFAEEIKNLVAGDAAFVGIMSNGTSGDINNINFTTVGTGKQAPGEQIRIVARSVAQAGFEAYKKIQHRPHAALASAQTELELGVRLPSEKDVARAREILAQAKGPILKGHQEVYARETVLLAKYPGRVPVIVQAHRIGDLGIVTTPCETFVEIGLEIKKKSPLKHTFTIELANGYNGYLPTPEQHALGGYETWRARSSYLEVGASPRMTEAILGLLKNISK